MHKGYLVTTTLLMLLPMPLDTIEFFTRRVILFTVSCADYYAKMLAVIADIAFATLMPFSPQRATFCHFHADFRCCYACAAAEAPPLLPCHAASAMLLFRRSAFAMLLFAPLRHYASCRHTLRCYYYTPLLLFVFADAIAF